MGTADFSFHLLDKIEKQEAVVEKVAFKGPVDPLGWGDLVPPFTGCNYILKRDVVSAHRKRLIASC